MDKETTDNLKITNDPLEVKKLTLGTSEKSN